MIDLLVASRASPCELLSLFLSLNCMPLVQSPFQQYRVVCLVNRQFHHLPQLFVRLRYQLDLTAPAPGPISVRAAISRPAAPSNQQPATNCLLGCLWPVQAGVSPFSAAVSFPVPSIQFIFNCCTLPLVVFVTRPDASHPFLITCVSLCIHVHLLGCSRLYLIFQICPPRLATSNCCLLTRRKDVGRGEFENPIRSNPIQSNPILSSPRVALPSSSTCIRIVLAPLGCCIRSCYCFAVFASCCSRSLFPCLSLGA